ncbi:peptidylprolyl isomerase [Alkalilacustris brevis]|uniref:peptidylprolyl isomerase n=1 Tax=Alkalilacustris brevis TaxID=2026338 RepID=UPI000E0D2724|nr:peptidylprolyl isomerase [Alkalilacustris brevis]
MKRMSMAMAGLAVALAASNAQAETPVADTVVAEVNGHSITLGHMIAMRARLPEQFQSVDDEVLFEGILDQLVEQSALAQEAGDAIGRRAQIDLDNMTREIVANSLLTRAVEAEVTEEAIEGAYAERYLDGDPQTEFNAAHILVETEGEAQDLRVQLLDGAEFADLAREHSRDPGSGANGGDLGWFGLGMMVEPFENAVVALEPGEISDPVQSQFGWHLIRLNETRAQEAPALEAVRAQLVGELQQEVVRNRIAEARESAQITLSAEGIDPALLREQTLLDD